MELTETHRASAGGSWRLYLQTPAGFTKREALNTVPADNTQRHWSLATGGPHQGGLILPDWTRVLYPRGTHRRVGEKRERQEEKNNRQTAREGGKEGRKGRNTDWVGETHMQWSGTNEAHVSGTRLWRGLFCYSYRGRDQELDQGTAGVINNNNNYYNKYITCMIYVKYK